MDNGSFIFAVVVMLVVGGLLGIGLASGVAGVAIVLAKQALDRSTARLSRSPAVEVEPDSTN